MNDRPRAGGPDERLMRAWVNERCSPNILQYATDLVSLVQGRINRAEQNMMEKNDDEQFQKWATYLALELDRIRFLLKSYLRCRLMKIQMYAFHVCDNPVILARLSPSETEFALSLREAYAATMQAGVLGSLARPDLREIESRDLKKALSEGPDIKKHVVVISESSIDLGFDLQNRPMQLQAGTMTAVPFELVQDVLESGQLRLV
jgi:GINS complex subunit 4